jgi:sec-independent protein translocase protein TatB
MFDIGFSELLVIGVVALIVIGPEKLPRVARTVGHLAGRLQRYVSDVKADINREIELEELRKMRDSMQQAATNFESSVQSELNKTETDLNKSVEAVVGDLPGEVKSAGAKVAETKAAEAPPAAATPNPSEIGVEDSKKSGQAKVG